jgi:hypothetical protein
LQGTLENFVGKLASFFMTTFQPPEKPNDSKNPSPRHDVALWASLAAFFGSLLAIGIFDLLNPDQWQEYLGALIVAAITGGGVYAKERLDYAKREEAARDA